VYDVTQKLYAGRPTPRRIYWSAIPMSLADELERLARLRADGRLTQEEYERAKSQVLSPQPFPVLTGFAVRSVRRNSPTRLLGLPLWSVAFGPDPSRGEIRGHARGIFAFGDMATGFFAMGGLARGIVAIGGLAVGLVSLGGLAIGLLAAVGGGALGGIAFGGAAIGYVAVGGGAAGYYALGGAAAGVHTISPLHQDPEAVAFFHQFLPWVRQSFRR
jgi:hypothetical protein